MWLFSVSVDSLFKNVISRFLSNLFHNGQLPASVQIQIIKFVCISINRIQIFRPHAKTVDANNYVSSVD